MNIYKGEGYCFFDEKAIWDKIYESLKVKAKNEFYEIWDTFKMDSEIAASEKRDEEKRIRKRPHQKGEGGAAFLADRSKIVENAWKAFIKDGRIKNERKTAENNKIAREAATKFKEFGWIERFLSMNTSEMDTVIAEANGSYEVGAEKVNLFRNDRNMAIKIMMDNENFIIPEQSQFILGPLESIKHLDYADKKYDLIIMDPPWPNKSVKRLRTYNTFEMADLEDLPIESLCHPKTAVIIWLTNNPTVHSGINQILESWNLKKKAICHWLKITKNGDPIYPFNSAHKVPFESFILAFPSDFNNDDEYSAIENDYCFISVPNSCHSRKPPLAAILEELTTAKFENTLELYARYLSPKTTSIGFEALKFQHLNSNFDFDAVEEKLDLS